MEQLIHVIPKELTNFLLVTLFSLLIGLSQRRLHITTDDSRLFGTDRTFTFIGLLGYILYIIEPEYQYLYMGGGVVIAIFLAINYYFKVSLYKDFGLTTVIIALITYCMAPLVITQAAWLYILVVVTVLIFTELKETFSSFSQKMAKEEFITLAKFLIIAGIILPIVPNQPIVSYLTLTPYKVWLAVVAISTISYLSYLIKNYVFPKSGIIISGILGGMYSSTVTTIILAKKSKENLSLKNNYASAILLATAMMYLRIGILMMLFNIVLFRFNFVFFLIMFLLSLGIGIAVFFYQHKQEEEAEISLLRDRNPLEFKVAMLFMVLFVAFSFITYFALQFFGNNGLNALSIIVGVTDIDPFLITLFGGKYSVSIEVVSRAAFQAIISNNVLKLIYALSFSGKRIRIPLMVGFGIIIIVNLLLLFFI
ncbi:MAG: DUF4010 domain-containing protein [Bacteroidota bacterium]